MKYGRWICAAMLVGLSLPAFGEVGGLKPVAIQPQPGMLSASLRAYQPSDFTSPRKDDGTVNEKARIVTLPMEGKTLLVAIDSAKPETKKPDVLRLDFTSRGKFDETFVIPIKFWSKGYYQFGPVSLDIPVGDKSLPVQARAEYRHQQNWRYLELLFGTALEGQCAFDEKVYPVQLVDNTSNLSCLDPISKKNNRYCGDRVFVGDAAKLPPQAREGKGSFFGQPVQVDGQWYELHVSDDLKITATPVEVETTQARIPHDKWSIVLLGKRFTQNLSGGKEPFTIPVDTYTVMQYQQQGTGEHSQAMLLCYAGGKGKEIPLKPGEVNELTIGSPLKAKIEAKVQGRQVDLSFRLADADDMGVSFLTNAKGQRPAPPTFEILDESGKQVHHGKMEFG